MCFLTAYFFEKKFSVINIEGFFSKADLGVVPLGDIRTEISYFYALEKFFYFKSINYKFFLNEKFIASRGKFAFTLSGFFAKPLLNRLYNRWLNLYNNFFGQGYGF